MTFSDALYFCWNDLNGMKLYSQIDWISNLNWNLHCDGSLIVTVAAMIPIEYIWTSYWVCCNNKINGMWEKVNFLFWHWLNLHPTPWGLALRLLWTIWLHLTLKISHTNLSVLIVVFACVLSSSNRSAQSELFGPQWEFALVCPWAFTPLCAAALSVQ